jgi:hypothetical protein
MGPIGVHGTQAILCSSMDVKMHLLQFVCSVVEFGR